MYDIIVVLVSIFCGFLNGCLGFKPNNLGFWAIIIAGVIFNTSLLVILEAIKKNNG